MTTVGIPGLDEMIEGGIPDGYAVLVTGAQALERALLQYSSSTRGSGNSAKRACT
jgi:KaiC/GvpD/RAD55 family RecA-like ATPase